MNAERIARHEYGLLLPLSNRFIPTKTSKPHTHAPNGPLWGPSAGLDVFLKEQFLSHRFQLCI